MVSIPAEPSGYHPRARSSASLPVPHHHLTLDHPCAANIRGSARGNASHEPECSRQRTRQSRPAKLGGRTYGVTSRFVRQCTLDWTDREHHGLAAEICPIPALLKLKLQARRRTFWFLAPCALVLAANEASGVTVDHRSIERLSHETDKPLILLARESVSRFLIREPVRPRNEAIDGASPHHTRLNVLWRTNREVTPYGLLRNPCLKRSRHHRFTPS
jgi:hypothetical protein